MIQFVRWFIFRLPYEFFLEIATLDAIYRIFFQLRTEKKAYSVYMVLFHEPFPLKS